MVLDEFPALNETNSQILRLLRNVVRALGFKLVVMGTNSSAANLVRANQKSRGKGTFEWCHIFTRLPKFNLATLSLNLDSNQNWINDILASSRPFFSIKAAECIQDLVSANIDKVIGEIACMAVDVKNVFRARYFKPFGLHGQVCLFLNVSYSESRDDKSYPSKPSLIHNHFAHLMETEVIKLDSNLETEGKKMGTSVKFSFTKRGFSFVGLLDGLKGFLSISTANLQIIFSKSC